jgi:hypothetical protein
MVLDRVKYQLGYPEAMDMLKHKEYLDRGRTVFHGYGATAVQYLDVGLNMTTKLVTNTHWCEGETFHRRDLKRYNHLYAGSPDPNENADSVSQSVLVLLLLE